MMSAPLDAGTIVLLLSLALYVIVIHRRRKARQEKEKADELNNYINWQSRKFNERMDEPEVDLDADAMGQALVHLKADATAESMPEWGYPPPLDIAIEEITLQDTHDKRSVYVVHVHSAAEGYLGREQYTALEERFASIPGVESCVQEDREVFVITTGTLTASALRILCGERFRESADIAFRNRPQQSH